MHTWSWMTFPTQQGNTGSSPSPHYWEQAKLSLQSGKNASCLKSLLILLRSFLGVCQKRKLLKFKLSSSSQKGKPISRGSPFLFLLLSQCSWNLEWPFHEAVAWDQEQQEKDFHKRLSFIKKRTAKGWLKVWEVGCCHKLSTKCNFWSSEANTDPQL